VTLSRKLFRTAWLSATSLFAVAALTVATVPASADRIGVLVLTQVSGVATGPITLPYNTPGTPLLDHFFYRDVSDDQHLKVMTALPRQQSGSGVIDVAFSDQSLDEQYEYRIAHQTVSFAGLSRGTLNDTCSGQCTRPIVRPPGDVVFVVSGFKFQYTSGDHHMDAIGILENNGQVTHWFNDQNDDDQYTVQIDYVWVPRSRFATVTSISGPGSDTGMVTRTIPAGDKVIRGFHVNNTASGGSGDNHIKRFGFLTNSASVDVFYGDNNPADSADWTYLLNYATLS
jgi:hypothetical protein